MQKKYLTVQEVAEILKLNPQTVYSYINEGELPAAQLGRTWRVQEEDLEYFVEQQKPAFRRWQQQFDRLLADLRKEAAQQGIGTTEIETAVRTVRQEKHGSRRS